MTIRTPSKGTSICHKWWTTRRDTSEQDLGFGCVCWLRRGMRCTETYRRILLSYRVHCVTDSLHVNPKQHCSIVEHEQTHTHTYEDSGTQTTLSNMSRILLRKRPVRPVISWVTRTLPSSRGLWTSTSSPSRRFSSASVCALYPINTRCLLGLDWELIIGGLMVKGRLSTVEWFWAGPFLCRSVFVSLRTEVLPSRPKIADGFQCSRAAEELWEFPMICVPEDRELNLGVVWGSSSVENRTVFTGFSVLYLYESGLTRMDWGEVYVSLRREYLASIVW